MTVEEVQALVGIQIRDSLLITNDHGINLKKAIVPPYRIPVIDRQVRNGQVRDKRLNCWLVGQENSDEGYKIIMSEDGRQFGLASRGFATDESLILTGWYGDLVSTFLAM